MQRNRQKRHFSIFNLLIIILSFILGVSILVTIFSVREAGKTFYDSESSLYNSLSDREYATLANRYYENAAGREDDPRVRKLAEYYAVGRYFEKAFFANAFRKAGNHDMETRYLQQMEEIEPDMGQFSAEKDQILKIFPDL